MQLTSTNLVEDGRISAGFTQLLPLEYSTKPIFLQFKSHFFSINDDFEEHSCTVGI